MHHKGHGRKKIVMIICVAILLAVDMFSLITWQVNPVISKPEEKGVSVVLPTSASIWINNNSDFSKYSFITGNGTSSNPYIINGAAINATGYNAGIYIGNTTAYFEIISTKIWGAFYSGIFIYNSTNVSIIDSEVNESAGFYGVYLANSSNVSIENTTLNAQCMGVLALESTYVSVGGNHIYAGVGVLFYSTSNSKVYDNTVNITMSDESIYYIANPKRVEIGTYQIQLLVNYSSDMREDFGNIRFYMVDGTELPYWIKTYTPGEYAYVWVRVPYILPFGEPIILKPANLTAPNESNASAVFFLYEDFERPNEVNWTFYSYQDPYGYYSGEINGTYWNTTPTHSYELIQDDNTSGSPYVLGGSYGEIYTYVNYSFTTQIIWDGKIGPYSMSTGYGTNDFSGYFKINSTMVWKSPYLWTLGLHPEFIDEKFTIPKGNVRIAFGIYRNAVIWGSTLFTFYVDTIRLRNYTTPEPYATASMNRTGISIQKGENNEIYGNTILTGIPRNPVYAELLKKNRENLKAWWPMNEGSGTTLVDHSGNGHNGTIYGARWVSGIEGDALYFNGSNYADVNMTVNYTQLTVTLWFKAYDLSLSNSRLIANSHTDIDKKGFQVMFNASGQDGFFDVGNGTAVGNAYWKYPLQVNKWYFAALVYDGQTVKAYINGNLVGETKFAGGAIAVSNYPINIGRNPVYAGDYFDGIIDDVRIYNVALSQEEIEFLHTIHPVADWSMNEGSGTTLVDHSGNGHNGTIYGARWVSGIEGDALYFNGSNYADVNMTVNYTQLTVTLWFKAYDLSLSNSRLIANSHTDIDKKGFQVMFNASGQDGFFDVGNGTAVGNAYWSYPLKEGVWYFAALVYDGQTVKAYINGNLVGETKFAGGAIAVSNYPINIGRNPVYAGDYFDGMIDDVRIYNIALSYDDILLLYNRPIAWWTMDDGNSTVVYDYTGSGHNGVLVNNTTYVPYGVSGHALYFNGSNYVDVNMTVDYAQLTVTLWFNPYNLSISNSRLIANSATWSDYKGFQIMFNSGGRSGYMDVGNGTAEGRVTWVYQLHEHTWYFAALVYDGSYVKAYIDGRLVGKAPLTGPVAPSNYTINIGRNPAYQGDYFEGLIDDVRIYRRALTSTEIYALYLDHYTGIELISSTNNSIHGNRMYGDCCGEAGVYMEDSSNNSVVWNHIIRYGSYGVYLFGSSNNSIVLNRIYNLTDYGIYLSPGSNFNHIYLNRVYNTHGSGWSYSPYTVQACDNGTNNVWSREGYGNYWYDWASNNSTNDQNNDGIVDWPYIIDGGSLDKYPLKLDTAGPWPTFHRDNYNGGKSEYSTANNNATLKWKYKTNGSVKMSPIIGADGTVYVVSDDGNLTALYPNGTVKWVFHTGGVIRCTPTITADGLIYFASSDGYIYSLYPDGTLRWKYYTGGYTIYSSTTVSEDGILYVVMGPSTLFAIAPDGTLMWKLDLGDEGSTPAIADDGTIYVGSAIKALFSLYPNGTVKWKSYAVGDPLSRDGAAIAPDGTIYIGDVYGNLTALYPNGTVKWVYRTHGGVYSTPAIGPTGTIYFGDMAGYFYALYPNGTLEWSYYVGGYIYSSPAISSDGTVYFGATDTPYGNYTYALYANNGTLRWKYRLNGSIWSSPAIGKDGTVYIGCDDGYLYAIGPPVSTLHLTAKSGVSWVNLTWTPSPSENITEYRIYRRTNNTTYVLIATVPASQLWYNDTNVTTNVTYYYYVTAVNPSGESAPSNIVEATPRQVVPEFFSVLFVAAIVLCIAAASRRKFKNV